MSYSVIQTKYLGPTDYRGSRIVARADGVPKVSVPYDHALNVEDNHRAAAEKLANQHGWLRGWRLVPGYLPDGTGYAFVRVPKEQT